MTAAARSIDGMEPGRWLMLRRTARGMTQADLAHDSGLDLDAIAAIEAGDRDIPHDEAQRLGRALVIPYWVLPAIINQDPIQICMACGCTEYDACVDANGHSCGWQRKGLCTACAAGTGE